MSTAAAYKQPAVIATEDELKLGVQLASLRILEVSEKLNVTLIDTISDDDWKNWDASDEKALVADKSGLHQM